MEAYKLTTPLRSLWLTFNLYEKQDGQITLLN